MRIEKLNKRLVQPGGVQSTPTNSSTRTATEKFELQPTSDPTDQDQDQEQQSQSEHRNSKENHFSETSQPDPQNTDELNIDSEWTSSWTSFLHDATRSDYTDTESNQPYVLTQVNRDTEDAQTTQGRQTDGSRIEGSAEEQIKTNEGSYQSYSGFVFDSRSSFFGSDTTSQVGSTWAGLHLGGSVAASASASGVSQAEDDTDESGGMSTAATVGTVVGVLAAVGLLAAVFFSIRRFVKNPDGKL